MEEYNDVFADIANVLLFDGEERIKPDELEDTNLKAQYKADDSVLHELERDTVKRWVKDGTILALCGMENQTKVERFMPVRMFGYDGTSYRSQLLDEKVKKIYPVIPIVLYFGKGHWNQPKNLKEVVSIPAELDEYINDYKIHVFEISWLTDEQVAKFKSDFKVIADFFTQKCKTNNYVPTTTTIKHVDEVLKFLSIFAEEDEFAELIRSGKSKEVKNMCEVITYIKNESKIKGIAEGRAEGKAIGIAEGRAEGIAEGRAIGLIENIENLQKNLKLSLEDALNAVGENLDNYKKAKMIIG